jgi:alkanesulfonate monooxygenase SsuD/methylene tetrahydromethanopterin reductase-like flavin-dependent oxidoreductase (luciferase family)
MRGDAPDGVRLGIGIEGVPARRVADLAAVAENLGYDSAWMAQLPNKPEVTVLLAAVAATTTRLEIASAVTPLYSRPAVIMAQTAMTIDELSGGRFALGIGLGHRQFGEWMVGRDRTPAVAATREYLDVVEALVRTGEVNLDGRWHSGHASYAGARRRDLPLLLGAFGPRLTELAAERADGIILWVCHPGHVTDHVLPALERGWRRRGGRPAGFRVVAMTHAAITGDRDADRTAFGRQLTPYLRVPSYRTLFTRSGFGGCVERRSPDAAMVDALLAGSEDEMRDRMIAYRAAGVDEVVVCAAGTAQRDQDGCVATLAAVANAARRARPAGVPTGVG